MEIDAGNTVLKPKIRSWIVMLCASYYHILLSKNAHHTAPSIPALFAKQSVTISCAYHSRSTAEFRLNPRMQSIVNKRKLGMLAAN
jgi:hypothetical protein